MEAIVLTDVKKAKSATSFTGLLARRWTNFENTLTALPLPVGDRRPQQGTTQY